MPVTFLITNVDANTILDLLPPHAADVDDTGTGHTDEGNQTGQDTLDTRTDFQLGNASAHSNRNTHRTGGSSSIGETNLLHVHGNTLVGVGIVDRDIQRLVDPLPKDDTSQTWVGHQHSTYHQQVGGNESCHSERKQDDLTRVRMHRRIHQLFRLPELLRFAAWDKVGAGGTVGWELGFVRLDEFLCRFQLGIGSQQRQWRRHRCEMLQSSFESGEVVAILGDVHHVRFRSVFGRSGRFSNRVHIVSLSSDGEQRGCLDHTFGARRRGDRRCRHGHPRESLPLHRTTPIYGEGGGEDRGG